MARPLRPLLRRTGLAELRDTARLQRLREAVTRGRAEAGLALARGGLVMPSLAAEMSRRGDGRLLELSDPEVVTDVGDPVEVLLDRSRTVGAKIILVEEVPPGEKWDAVRDRVKRAASAENIVTYDQDIAAWVADYGEEGGPA